MTRRIEVTQEAFYKRIGGPEDIHPRSERDHSLWLNQRTHAVVGWSEPGYASPYGTPKRYWLAQ